MGKKKRKDLIEENLTNTDVTNTDVGFGEMAIQQTITNCSDIAKNTDAIVERIGAKLDHLIEWFEREQEAREREQEARDRPFVRLKREWEDRKALLERQRLRREEQERREREARKNLLQRAKDRDGFLRNTWLGGKWNTPYGIYVFIATEIDSGFYGQNDKTPFLCFIKSSEEDENRLQFEYYGESVYATVDGENLLWDDGDTYTRHDEQKEEQRIQREQLQDQLAGKWMTFNATGGNVLFRNLDVYESGSDTPFLRFVNVDLDGYLVFEFGDGDRVRAKQKGDTLEWSDGSVYYKLPERVEPEGGSSSSLFEGNWKTWDKYGVKEGTVTIQDLDPSGCEAHFLLLQRDDDSSPVKLRFTGREGDRFSFECHGDADTAVFVSNGDQITWGDGCVCLLYTSPSPRD